jgi:osmotically-inducible protein OsmY
MGWWMGYAASRALGKLVNGALGSAQVPSTDYLLPDEKARQALCARLTAEPGLDARDVHVSVLSSEVALTGRVASEAAKSRAEALARSIAGVKSVRNELAVS